MTFQQAESCVHYFCYTIPPLLISSVLRMRSMIQHFCVSPGLICYRSTGAQWNGTRVRAYQDVYNEPKYRWEYDLQQPFPFEQIVFPSSPTSFIRFFETDSAT